MLHSEVGPSALQRILSCPGSVQLIRSLPEDERNPTSVFAATGTVAHDMVDRKLSSCLRGAPPSLPPRGHIYVVEGYEIPFDRKMDDDTDIMSEFCQIVAEDADEILIEEIVDLDMFWKQRGRTPPVPVFGTTDFAAWSARTNTLTVVDYKNGVYPVPVKDNAQCLDYAAGTIKALGILPETVRLVIVQPNSNSEGPAIQQVQVSGLDVLVWADEVMVKGIDRAFGAQPWLMTGSHCTFCAAKTHCPAVGGLINSVTGFPAVMPEEPRRLDHVALGQGLDAAAVIRRWIEALRGEASRRIEGGADVPGWKLVPKRATRRFNDQEAVLKIIWEYITAGFGSRDDYVKIEPLSPKQIQDNDPTLYDRLYRDGYISSVSSGSTIAAEGDPRKRVEVLTGADDFAGFEVPDAHPDFGVMDPDHKHLPQPLTDDDVLDMIG